MYEKKYQVGIRHKVTGERFTLEVWAENTDDATYKLTGTLIGPNCEYDWTGTNPLYENNRLIRREVKN